MTPDDYCQQKTLRSGSSFYYSVQFLDPPRRRAVTALHAFCKELRDLVESTADESAARIKLAWWRTEIAALFRGDPQHLVTRALAPCLGPYHLPQSCFDDMIDGMEIDLLQTRYLDFIALERYCDLTSGAAMACVARILGYTDAATLSCARSLGRAIALTNIIRTAGAAARGGRVYLPVSELQQFNVPVADVLNARYSDNFTRLMQFHYERATGYYEKALNVLPEADRGAQRASLIMATLSRTLLEEIRLGGFLVLHQRTSLTPIRKLWLAWKTWVFV